MLAKDRDRLFARLGIAVTWALPLVVAHLYLKYTLLQYGGLDIARTALSLGEITPLMYMRFYAWDIVESLLLIPAALFVLLTLVPRRFNTPVLLVVIGAGLLAAVVCWASYINLGRYPTPGSIVDFLRAYQVDRATVDPLAILSTYQLIKAFGLLMLVLVPLVLCRALGSWSFKRRNLAYLSGAYIVVVSAAAGLAITGTMTSYHRGHLSRIAHQASTGGAIQIEDGRNYSRNELLAQYNRAVFPDGLRATSSIVPANLERSTPPPNVIVIVLETASARDYVFSREEMPNVAALLDHSIQAKNHLSAYPYSVRANFSLFTSVYDLDSKKMMADLLKDAEPRPMDALPYVLKNRGYETRYYYPHQLIHKNEAWMWPYLGFEEVIAGDAFDMGEGDDEEKPGIVPDQALFDRVIDDINRDQVGPKAPFMLAVVTSLGHAPYPDVRSAAARVAAPQASRADLVAGVRHFLDQQIGRLVETLRQNGALENTILVITGDHGPRSIPDDPRLDLRVLNEASFHVPLLIHFPRAIDQAITIDYVTSHVDVAPTIFKLAGIPTDDLLLTGLPVTDARIEDRATFVLGGHYFGSNGLHYRGRFFMENEIAELAYVNDDFSFGPDALMKPTDPELMDEAERYRGMLNELRQSQLVMANRLRDADNSETNLPDRLLTSLTSK
jgi:arylsulfatase A-like enzyme